eukprot:NODE_2648_length_1018_cov_57.305275_g2629_i0.p1 GENE.NODE_2648_length_1018_cov_57.305275_g2629_i0~~NODE_2648_length_1018_cov_57.305275_g2629_i0.p1  ORF type:complete len:287 (-),score=46.51 NODE_2648_length_1018_cov_57.305275_g2629_i0:86-946(-)
MPIAEAPPLPHVSPNMAISDFDVGRRLGRGKYGSVYLVRERRTKFVCALKVIKKKDIAQDKIEVQLRREIEIQGNIRHKNVLRLYGYFCDETSIYLVLEFAEKGELYRHLQAQKRFPEPQAAAYIGQLAEALHYLHAHHVIHRDIKPENLLVDHNGNIKIADFGWSVHTLSLRRRTLCGTLDYLPPEMLKNRSYDNTADVWCLGVLCYEFLVGSPPFEHEQQAETKNMITQAKYEFPEGFPDGAKDLVSQMLQLDPCKRLPLPAVLEHPWITKHAASKPPCTLPCC